MSVNEIFVDPNSDGEFRVEVGPTAGPNIIEIVASVATGDQQDQVLVVIYVP